VERVGGMEMERMTVTAEPSSPKGDELGIPTNPSFHLPRKHIIF